MSLKIPARLKKGDTVSVVATARAVDIESVKAGIGLLEGWGLKVIRGKSLYLRHQMFAGNDRERMEDLQEALDSKEVKAVFCARGGYGTTRILDSIDWNNFMQHPKWVCGFSDITALLCHIHSLGYACLHSTMPQLFIGKDSGPDCDSLHEALFNQKARLKATAQPDNQVGMGEGLLVGGNLSLLVHLIGTKSEVDINGKILLIEEVDEYMYHLDRMMVQLKRTGKLQRLAGLVVGHLTKIKEGDLEFGIGAAGIIKSHFQGENIPIGFGFPFGHNTPNLSVPLGVMARLDVTAQGSELTLEYKSSD